MALNWYFLRVQVGREDRIRESMARRVKQAGLEERVPQILVPTETVAEHRGGKRKIQKKKLYPGYLMVQMDMDEHVWFALRETPGFGDFVGARQQPSPMSPEEVENVLGRMDTSRQQPKMAVTFNKGDRVKIKQGAFENMDGVVEGVNPEKGTLEVSVTFFGRSTPVSLGYWEVEPI
ncbi:MAG: transcription termination/antitermination factor NusG [Planctomycetes bacterium]|nr:transcription termination/antitermination factor NusG [Planctomycetota bacterium]